MLFQSLRAFVYPFTQLHVLLDLNRISYPVFLFTWLIILSVKINSKHHKEGERERERLTSVTVNNRKFQSKSFIIGFEPGYLARKVIMYLCGLFRKVTRCHGCCLLTTVSCTFELTTHFHGSRSHSSFCADSVRRFNALNEFPHFNSNRLFYLDDQRRQCPVRLTSTGITSVLFHLIRVKAIHTYIYIFMCIYI